jgi:TrmH family RNA methyltransferase
LTSRAGLPDVSSLPGERIALVAGAGEPLAELCVRLGDASEGSGALTLLVGSERSGLPEEVVSACEHVAHIPIAAESLNAAMAATVALYETTTRRSTRVRAS